MASRVTHEEHGPRKVSGSQFKEESVAERGNEAQRSRRFSGLRRRESTTEVFWPADLLPIDCPGARILTWGYDLNASNFFSGSANKGHVFTYAKDLLYALGRARQNFVSTIYSATVDIYANLMVLEVRSPSRFRCTLSWRHVKATVIIYNLQSIQSLTNTVPADSHGIYRNNSEERE
jgi:hypothetical protein